MKKFRQFMVGNIEIIKEDEALKFNGVLNAKAPYNVIIAMLAVGRYLKWHNCQPSNYGGIATITHSASGRTVYVNHKELMHICSTGNTDWCYVTKYQLQGLINEFFQNWNTEVIPANAFTILEMLKVEKMEPYVLFETEDDYRNADEKFINYMNTMCPKRGAYIFEKKKFKEETGLLTDGLVWHYLTNRFEEYRFNAGYVSAAHTDETSIHISIR